jgi:MinD-like ATPase involved in chromosome partitioning or flagellar assembly
MSLFGNKLWAVGGGKGGTGKSFLTASLAVTLARMGKTVIAVDADLGAPNLHILMGIRNPGKSLLDTIESHTSAEQALQETREPGVRMLACTGDSPGLADLAAEVRSEMIRHVRALAADHVLLDLASGGSAQVLDFFDAADLPIVVSTPDPASVRRTLSFLRCAVARRSAPKPRAGGGICSGAASTPTLRPWLVWNMAVTEQDRHLAGVLQSAARRHLGVELMLAGTIAASDAAREAARRMTVPDFRDADGDLGRQIEETARRLLAGMERAERPSHGLPESDGAPLSAGLNDCLELFGRRFHIQTEDMGARRRMIATHVFLEGRVIHSKRAAYPQDAGAAGRALIAEMMRAQHWNVIQEIKNQNERIAQP